MYFLYEVTFQKVYEDGTTSKEKTWQIPAKSQWDACANLGLLLTEDNYKISVNSVVRVK